MSDAPKGRGRGRGRRIAATTLSGPLPSASPSASPAPPPPSHNDDTHRTADATDDAPPAPTPTSAPAPAAAPQRRASVKRVASVGVGSTRAPSVGSSMSRTPSLGPNAATPAPERAPRPVGGLLAVNSEYRASASSSQTGTSAGARPKFRPNMRRSLKVQDDDDDEDVKMEDGDSFRNKRGPRAPRARQDLEMTASGPMAQGPGGPPRAWGAGRPAGAGASGAAVMAASRAGTLNRMLDDDSDASDLEGGGYGSDAGGGGGGGRGSGDEGAHVRRFKAVDLNDIGAEPGGGARDGEDEAVTPLTLPRDPKVLRTKIRRLQERKNERAKREARHAAKAQGLVKPEPTDDALPASTSTSTSATPLGGTPAPSATGIAPSTAASLIAAAAGTDSKEGSLALLSVDEDKEAKDLKDLEEEEKKEISLSEAFDLAPETRGELYMFQFPRKFPVFTPESSSSSATLATATGTAASASSSSTVKPDPDAPAALRKPAAPAWGRFGSRAEKASRWTEHEGRIGQLRVHESGKVTLRLKGDLRYEVLPAAQPSFLQEVAILDHRAAAGSAAAAAAANGNGHTNGTKTKTKKPKHRRRSSSSGSSSSSSSSSSSDADADQPRHRGRPVPPESLVVLGQTQKKFLVVPDINDLLASVAQQEKDERDEERRVKLERARGAGAAAGAGAGAGKGRR